jgi:hypothetical protein
MPMLDRRWRQRRWFHTAFRQQESERGAAPSEGTSQGKGQGEGTSASESAPQGPTEGSPSASRDRAGTARLDAPDAMALWRTVARIADALDDQETRWCLVGGLMVALFAIEAGQLQRPTTDIDILGDARQRPSGTEAVTKRLENIGGALKVVSGFESERGFRLKSMKNTERLWLRSIESALDIEDRRLEARFDPARLRIARASYRRLSG